MQPDQPRPPAADEWEDTVSFRNRSSQLSGPDDWGTLFQHVNEPLRDSNYPENISVIRHEASLPTRSRQHRAAAAAARKHHVKRTVKDRSFPEEKSSADNKSRSDESLALVNYYPPPSWLLEIDGEELNPSLPSPFPNELVKRHLHNVPDVIADLVSKAALSGEYGRTFARNLMTSVSQKPAQLHAMMFAEMVVTRIKSGVGNPTVTELMVGAETVRHLNQEISHLDPERSLSDSNFWVVLILAYSGAEDKLRSSPGYPRQSFLRELQSLHIYGKMATVLEHVLGLVQMMNMLGGLQKIKTPGIAATISW